MLSGMGVDPIHLGLIMVLNLVLGGITSGRSDPFVMARVAGAGVMDVFLGGWPYFLVLTWLCFSF